MRRQPMSKFCIHEQHAGVCEKTGGYCSEGPCPYEEMVDYAPMVHGRWIGIDSSFWKPTHRGDIPVFRKTYRCSECRRRTAIAENYCPNCGAKMDKEETNELD
jgi:hypothetical protein